MNWLETGRTGLIAVMSHRLRSILTMLGILIGIAAVILTVGLGEGAQQQVGSEISALGSNLLIVSPGSTTSTAGVQVEKEPTAGQGGRSRLLSPARSKPTFPVGGRSAALIADERRRPIRACASPRGRDSTR